MIKFTTSDSAITIDLSKIMIIRCERKMDLYCGRPPQRYFELTFKCIGTIFSGECCLYDEDAWNLLTAKELYDKKQLTV